MLYVALLRVDFASPPASSAVGHVAAFCLGPEHCVDGFNGLYAAGTCAYVAGQCAALGPVVFNFPSLCVAAGTPRMAAVAMDGGALATLDTLGTHYGL